MSRFALITDDYIISTVAIENPKPPLEINSVTVGVKNYIHTPTGSSCVVYGTGIAPKEREDVYEGEVTVTFNRIDLAVLFKGIDNITCPHTPENDDEWVDLFEELFDITFPKDEVTFTVLSVVGRNTSLRIEANGDSNNFTGKVILTLLTAALDIDTIPNKVLGYYKPIPESDVLEVGGVSVFPNITFACNNRPPSDRYRMLIKNIVGKSGPEVSQWELTLFQSPTLINILRYEFGAVIKEGLVFRLTRVSPTVYTVTFISRDKTSTGNSDKVFNDTLTIKLINRI